jgi:hypothetical protein
VLFAPLPPIPNLPINTPNIVVATFQVFQIFQRYMLQVFHMDVAKIRNVAYVAMTIYVCCKHLLQMFNLDIFCKCVYLDVIYVSHVC